MTDDSMSLLETLRADVSRVSTRRGDDLVRVLGITGMSKIRVMHAFDEFGLPPPSTSPRSDSTTFLTRWSRSRP
jgi:hypothetical protein